MSLQLAAEHLKRHGRGKDTQLVHMTSDELKNLQDMAVAHGGSLTINPHTGLPEAGFLDGLLKMAVPIALMATGMPAALGASLTGAATAGALESGLGMGLISGGLTALGTGDIRKGLTAGLGSGLMTGIGQSFLGGSSAGSNVSTPTLAQSANQVIPQATADVSNQGFTSMMQNPAVSGNVNPVGAQLANAQSTINAQYANPATAMQAKSVPVPTPGQGTGLFDQASSWWKNLSTPAKIGVGAGGLGLLSALTKDTGEPQTLDKGMIRPYTYSANKVTPDPNSKNGQPQQLYDAQGNPVLETSEKRYFNPVYTPGTPIPASQANSIPSYADGGIAAMANGGTGLNQNRGYPGGRLDMTQYATPSQIPTSNAVVGADYEAKTDPYTGEPTGFAAGGLPNLGSYSDGGRMLKGPGDGMSDNIPALIGHKQPARLADGEFVVPADVVSHLGNGSTDAGAKRLYAMMDNVRAARTGNKKQGKQINAEKYLPA